MSPPASDLLDVPVVSGDRFTGIAPSGALPSVPPGAQSRLKPCEFVDVHAPPAFAPRSHVPWPGLAGDPVAEHCGHGCVAFPVRNEFELRATFSDAAPVPRFNVPLAGELSVFTTHVLVPPLAIGSGVPKKQPVVVQSGVALFAAGDVDVAPMVQLEPAQLSE